MVDKRCFELTCMLDVEYVCQCTPEGIYCCEKHLSKHLRLPNGAHLLESIFVEPCEETKEAILNFLSGVNSSYQKQKKKIMAFFSHRFFDSKNDLENLIKEIDTYSAELNHFFTIITQAKKILKSEQDPVLGLLSLQPEEAVEKLKAIIPATPDWYNDVKIICEPSQKIEKMIESIIKDKFENYIDKRLAKIEINLEEQNKTIGSVSNELANVKDTISGIIHDNQNSQNEFENWKQAINIKADNDRISFNSQITKITEDLYSKLKETEKAQNQSVIIIKDAISNLVSEQDKNYKKLEDWKIATMMDTKSEQNLLNSQIKKLTEHLDQKLQEENERHAKMIETLNADLASLKHIINENSKNLKGLKEEKEQIERTVSILNSHIISKTEDISPDIKLDKTESNINLSSTEIYQDYSNAHRQNPSNPIEENKSASFSVGNIKSEANEEKIKREPSPRRKASEEETKECKPIKAEIDSSSSIIRENRLEEEVKANIKIPQEKTKSTQSPKITVQQGANSFHTNPIVYNINQENNSTTLYIYDTESESKEKEILQTPEILNGCTCITQLPNGKLFCYGRNSPLSGITLLVGENYQIEVLPYGTPSKLSSAIYFNQNVYCFGGVNRLSRRFDLVQNRWRELTPMLKSDTGNNSIIFNGNILISGSMNNKLLRYSIAANSFTTLPYKFAEGRRKILINAERLYLIECPGWIYESEFGSDTAWRQISNSTINYDPDQVYCAYNKGGVYIGCTNAGYVHYCKFDLNEKRLLTLGEAKKS